MEREQITKQWRAMERRVKELTGADMVEARITERGHVTFEVTFTNRSESVVMDELLEGFE